MLEYHASTSNYKRIKMLMDCITHLKYLNNVYYIILTEVGEGYVINLLSQNQYRRFVEF